LLDTSNILRQKYFKELSLLAQQLSAAAEKNVEENDKITNTMSVAEFFFDFGEPKSVDYFKKVNDYCGNNVKRAKFAAVALNKAAVSYVRQSRFDSAIKYCYKSIVICLNQNDSLSLLSNYKLLSDIYIILGLYEKAIRSNEAAFNIARSLKVLDECLERQIFKMRCYRHLAKASRAYVYRDSVTAIARYFFTRKEKDSAQWIGAVYLVLGQLYYDKGDFSKARAFFDSSLLKKYTENAKYYSDTKVKDFYKSICLVRTGNYSMAQELLQHPLTPVYEVRRLIYEALYQRSAEDKRWRDANTYYIEYVRAGDSMKITESSALLAEAEQKYDVAQKQAQITALENSNLLKEKKQSRLVTFAVSAALILLLVIVVLVGLYRQSRVRRQGERRLLVSELYKMEASVHDERQLQFEKIAAQRKKIAEDMHDEVSSGLAAFRFYIVDLKARAENKETTAILTELEAEAQVLYQQARDFMKNLNVSKPSAGYNVCELADQLSARFANEKLLVIKSNIDRDGVEQYFTRAKHYELYLVIKEAVANSIKHAGASLVEIGIWFKDHTCFFSIGDNGKGFNTETAGTDGLGLKSIANRIQTINGDLKIRSAGSGTLIEGFFPV
jgi:signal transduction histidine kinase